MQQLVSAQDRKTAVNQLIYQHALAALVRFNQSQTYQVRNDIVISLHMSANSDHLSGNKRTNFQLKWSKQIYFPIINKTEELLVRLLVLVLVLVFFYIARMHVLPGSALNKGLVAIT